MTLFLRGTYKCKDRTESIYIISPTLSVSNPSAHIPFNQYHKTFTMNKYLTLLTFASALILLSPTTVPKHYPPYPQHPLQTKRARNQRRPPRHAYAPQPPRPSRNRLRRRPPARPKRLPKYKTIHMMKAFRLRIKLVWFFGGYQISSFRWYHRILQSAI